MTTHDLTGGLWAWAAGGLLGAFFFGGLWWTIRRSLSSKHVALWFLGSLLVRTGIALGGFLLVSGDAWSRWLMCLVGFVMARVSVRWLTRDSSQAFGRWSPGASDAP